MNYILILILSFLLSFFSPVENDQPKITVTFESASLVYHTTDKKEWSFSATVNDLDIGMGEKLEFENSSEDEITFILSGSKSGQKLGEAAKKYSKPGSNSIGLSIKALRVENPSVIYAYGANPISIDIRELLSKKPLELNILVSVKETTINDALDLGRSTRLIYKFKLDYH